MGGHLDVGDGRVEGAGPVDKAGTAVDDSFLMEPDKGLRHSCGEFLGSRERQRWAQADLPRQQDLVIPALFGVPLSSMQTPLRAGGEKYFF